MQVTTIEEARQLVGRTFERDGKRRQVTRCSVSLAGDKCLVMWGDDDGGGAELLPKFSDWLAGAKEVTE